ncbi:Do family serine endopeptidase [Thiospirillum jenense]|uniref:Probable periplasmic serine endoprotease DegP-like n=1 Tax=Thiospirillum jenense TaxID=1653858 RepID=A0A839H8M5_9GAMM|nr:Do family serine endopeptidase [Thiospirillum jenense]MBB1125344.1 Do family serine endopeptidase [Thiospirillum jenense]
MGSRRVIWSLLWVICSFNFTSTLAARPVSPVPGLPDFTLLVKRNGPVVVNISSKQLPDTQAPEPNSGNSLPEDSPLYDFFQRFFGDDGEPLDPNDQGRSLGSGFFISADGYVVTNAHVVEAATEIIVRTSDRREFIAQLIGVDERSDIALLKVDGQDLPTAAIGVAADLQVGEWVLAIGSPFGFDHSATAGIVSAKGRSLPNENYVPFIQTDVAINPGNSGGPLFNLAGKVVGVNSQIYSRTGGFMGVSFAIPIEVVMDVVHQLSTRGRVSRGWLGVLIQDVTRELAETFSMPQPRGALVTQVLPDSPAMQAGIQVGDIILSFNRKPVDMSSALPPLVGQTPVGSQAQIEVLRIGKVLPLTLVLSELPDESSELIGDEEDTIPPVLDLLGLAVRDLNAEQRAQLDIKVGGILVDVVSTGAAETAGIRVGDVLLTFDQLPIDNVAHWQQLLTNAKTKAGRAVAVLVQRGDGRLFYPVRMPAAVPTE